MLQFIDSFLFLCLCLFFFSIQGDSGDAGFSGPAGADGDKVCLKYWSTFSQQIFVGSEKIPCILFYNLLYVNCIEESYA